MVPVFRYKNQNEPYVQIMDEFLLVDSFAPYYLSDEYEMCTLDEQHSLQEGWPGLISFRAPDLRIITCTVSQLFGFVEERQDELKEYPLLMMQLLRLTSADFAVQYEAWRQVSRTYFRQENQEFWLQAETSFFQHNDLIWRAINAPREPERKVPDLKLQSGDTIDVEELIKVLAIPTYYAAPNWERLWFLLLRKLPLDARTVDIAKNWLYHKYSSGEGFESGRNIFCAVIDNSLDLYRDDGFTDFCFELCSEGTLFSEDFSIPFRIVKLVFILVQKSIDSNIVRELLVKTLEENHFPPNQLEFFIDQLLTVLRESSVSIELGKHLRENLIPRLEVYDLHPEISSKVRRLRRLLPPE